MMPPWRVILASEFKSNTIELVRRQYSWPQLTSHVHKYVKSCEVCARAKYTYQAPCGLLVSIPPADIPWQKISLDFIVDLPPSSGNTTILVVVDSLTKMAHFLPLAKLPTSKETAEVLLKHVFKIHGLPSSLLSDRGTQFSLNFWRELCKGLHIKINILSAFRKPMARLSA